MYQSWRAHLMKGKRILCLLLAAVCMLSICACSENTGKAASTDSAAKNTSEDNYLIGYSPIDMENPYFITLQKSIQEVLDENPGFEMVTEDPGTDSDQQMVQIQNMIDEGIDAIILSPVDEDLVGSALEKLKQAGVKIINVDTKVKEFDYVDAYIGSNNYQAGYICGKDLISKCPEGGKVAILEAPTMNSVNDRIAGFEDALSEAENSFEIVERTDTRGELELALEQTRSILKDHPDIVAVMCGNDQVAVGAKTAMNLADFSKKVYIYGVDGSPDIKKELKKSGNSIVGTAAQSPITLGHDAATTTVKILTGQEYEKEIYEDVFMINADNVDEYGTDGWQ